MSAIAGTFSVALLVSGCSNHSGHSTNAHSTNASEAAGTDAASVEEADFAQSQTEDRGAHNEVRGEAKQRHDGVKTNHDVFHSKALEVPAGRPVPALTVRVDDDPVRGWNLYVGTANFDFTPQDINGESSFDSGHAHLYINEEAAQRIYSNWTHLPELPPGENTIRVTLNANSHETLTTQGQPIEESVTVDVYDPNES